MQSVEFFYKIDCNMKVFVRVFV